MHPLCSWAVGTCPVELMADQAGIDSLLQGLGLWGSACAAFSAHCLEWCWFQALKLWSAFHKAVSMWLLASESLPAPNFYPGSCYSDFVGSKSALQDLALGEQIHLVLDICSLKSIEILLTPETFPLYLPRVAASPSGRATEGGICLSLAVLCCTEC